MFRQKVLRVRNEYMRLFEKLDDADKLVSKNMSSLTLKDRERFDALEEELPLPSIVVFRMLARQRVSGDINV